MFISKVNNAVDKLNTIQLTGPTEESVKDGFGSDNDELYYDADSEETSHLRYLNN